MRTACTRLALASFCVLAACGSDDDEPGGVVGTTPAGTGGAGNTVAGTGAAGTAVAGTGSTGNVLFDVSVQLASDVDANAPGTVGIVTWSVDQTITEAHIELGLDTSYGVTAPVDLDEAGYRTLLLGMKPSSTYHFRVVAGDGSTSYASEDFTLETGPPPEGVSIARFDPVDEAGRERGFIVTSYWRGPGSSFAFILDADGDIVWWYASNITGIARARMSADGKNMWLVAANNTGHALERTSLDVLDTELYPNAIGSHDITPVTGERMAFLEYGEDDCDSIFEIDPSGATIEVFESEGVVMPPAGGSGFSGCHANALRYSAAEDVYTFSDVQSDILVVDRDGSVAWRLTERVAGGASAWGGRHHGHHLLDDGFVIFANRGGTLDVATMVEYTLDGTEIGRYESGAESANLGDVQRLPGGNTLITFSNDGVIHEVDAQGNSVLEVESSDGASFGYSLWRESLYGPPPDLNL